MLFKITKASQLDFEDYKEFKTLEELRDFVMNENKKFKSCIIYWEDRELIIYDD